MRSTPAGPNKRPREKRAEYRTRRRLVTGLLHTERLLVEECQCLLFFLATLAEATSSSGGA